MCPYKHEKLIYLDGILHEHADQAIDVLLPGNFEMRVDLVDQGFHAEY